VKITLDSVERTLALGSELGNRLRAGDLVILSGSLGAGKTTMTKGIATGMGVSGRVTSPTFVIARVHRPTSDDGRTVPLVHVDAYRLAGAVELDDLDLDTDLDAAAVVIEWGEGVAERLSDERLIIDLVRLPDDTRTASLTAVGDSWLARVPEIVAALGEVADASPYGSR
jgi:tRNA threonylcarbamoyladenosine biosynthesis protein TsaE